MTGESTQITSTHLSMSEKQSSHYALLQQPITTQYKLKSNYVIKVASMKNILLLSRATIELTLFAVSKDKWSTKKGTGKSTKNTLYILQYICQKAPLGPKQCRTVNKSST